METTSYPKEIRLFFNEIVDKIRDVLDPEYILLAGSFGKESWLYFNDELISDFELVFVCKKTWSLKRKTQLLKQLNNNYPYEISLKGFLLDKIKNRVISNYAFKNPGYISLDFFDAFSDPVFLYKKNDISFIVDLDVAEIPVWEAWRLYVNRMGDILKLKCYAEVDKKTQDYYWLKIFESTAGAYCLINKIYNKNIVKRLEMFTQEHVLTNNELDENCKNSFPIIQQALLARSKHDLLLFNLELSEEESMVVVNSWMSYFEKKLAQAEQLLPINTKDDFQKKYLKNKILQVKYLGFNYFFNKALSNSIRLLYNPKLLNFNFKFYNHRYSWRHLILLSISSAFEEISLGRDSFPETKKVLNNIVKNKQMDTQDFMLSLLKYWRILR
jgi:hypothetical protein